MFDLEKEIKKWRNSLNANEALEDGAKEELECHLRDKIEHLIDLGNPKEQAFKEALTKIGSSEVLGTEYYRQTTQRLSGRPPWEKKGKRSIPSSISWVWLSVWPAVLLSSCMSPMS
jgi:hypothetical protein